MIIYRHVVLVRPMPDIPGACSSLLYASFKLFSFQFPYIYNNKTYYVTFFFNKHDVNLQ